MIEYLNLIIKPGIFIPEVQKLSKVNKCNAITDKGKICKRDVQSGSDFCWQHLKKENQY